MLTVLKSKIRELVIDQCKVEYSEGSITIPQDIMQRADIFPYERVEVNSKYYDGRVVTYAIPGDRVEMNGGAANYFTTGEIVHVNVFKQISEDLVGTHKPIII